MHLPFQKTILKGSWTREILTPWLSSWGEGQSLYTPQPHGIWEFRGFSQVSSHPTKDFRKQLPSVQEQTAWELRKTKVTIKQLTLAKVKNKLVKESHFWSSPTVLALMSKKIKNPDSFRITTFCRLVSCYKHTWQQSSIMASEVNFERDIKRQSNKNSILGRTNW